MTTIERSTESEADLEPRPLGPDPDEPDRAASRSRRGTWCMVLVSALLLVLLGQADGSGSGDAAEIEASGVGSSASRSRRPALGPEIALPPGSEVTAAVLVKDDIWLAVDDGGTGALVPLDRFSGEARPAVPLSGVVAVNSLHLVGDALVFATTPTEGTPGGVHALSLTGDGATPRLIAPFDRAVSLASDGEHLWVRGEGAAARVDPADGTLDLVATTGAGSVDGHGRTTWLTEARARAVRRLDGTRVTAEVALEGPLGPLLAVESGVFVASGIDVVRLDRRTLELQEIFGLSEPAVALAPLDRGVLALGEHSLTRVAAIGESERLPLAVLGPARTLAVSASGDVALVCSAEADCTWVKLPRNASDPTG